MWIGLLALPSSIIFMFQPASSLVLSGLGTVAMVRKGWRVWTKDKEKGEE